MALQIGACERAGHEEVTATGVWHFTSSKRQALILRAMYNGEDEEQTVSEPRREANTV